MANRNDLYQAELRKEKEAYAKRDEQVRRNCVIEDPAVQYTQEANPVLIDQLKARRSLIAREANAKVKRLDRAINLLEQTDAETVVNDSMRLLQETY